jgi:hypothetical protein
MRILRKRIVLVIIFALSLTYCILSFLREVRICAHNDPSPNHRNIRKFIYVTILDVYSICKVRCCRLHRQLIRGYVLFLIYIYKDRDLVPKVGHVHKLS